MYKDKKAIKDLSDDELITALLPEGSVSFDYLLSRTFFRPRDLIVFLNHVISVAKQRDGDDRIVPDDITQAERQWSRDARANISGEYMFSYPYLRKLIDELGSLRLEEKYQMADFCQWIDLAKAELSLEVDNNHLIQVMYRTGVIGVYFADTPTRISFYYLDAEEIEDIADVTAVAFHPLVFRKKRDNAIVELLAVA